MLNKLKKIILKKIILVWGGDVGNLCNLFYNEETRLKWYGLVIFDISIGVMIVKRPKK